MRILIADDDPVYRCLLQSLLEKWGFEPLTACDGREAWDRFRDHPELDLLILDWKMPFLSGHDISRMIREQCPDRTAYILLLTASSGREDIMQVMIAGADDYLLKPFEPLDLKIRLRVAKRILTLESELAHARTAAAPVTSSNLGSIAVEQR